MQFDNFFTAFIQRNVEFVTELLFEEQDNQGVRAVLPPTYPTPPMTTLVIGCGAMGSIYAGLLATSGNDIGVVDVWADHVDAIRTAGLRVEGASGDRTVRIGDAVTDIAELKGRSPELVVIATKAQHVLQAAVSAYQLIKVY